MPYHTGSAGFRGASVDDGFDPTEKWRVVSSPRVPVTMFYMRRFRRQRTRKSLRGLIATVIVCGGMPAALAAFGGGSGQPPSGGKITLSSATANLTEQRANLPMCGSARRHTCIVDGDTIWLDGKNLRLMSFDTPEPHSAICGGAAEVALAKRASARLRELLNGNPWTVETFGIDGTGKRILATIRIRGRNVGDILIEERLARRWPDGDEWWCR